MHHWTLFILISASVSVHATQLTATSSTFQSVMSRAVGGDSVKLSDNLGKADLYNRNLSSLKTIDASGASFTDTLVMGNDSIGLFNAMAAESNVYHVRQALIAGFVRAPSFAIPSGSAMPPGIVPDPGVWALMIAGFAMIGLGQRRRRDAVAA